MTLQISVGKFELKIEISSTFVVAVVHLATTSSSLF